MELTDQKQFSVFYKDLGVELPATLLNISWQQLAWCAWELLAGAVIESSCPLSSQQFTVDL